MCQTDRIGGQYKSRGPVPAWAKLFGGIVFTLMLIGFLVVGTVQHLVEKAMRR